jgi:hypothetical protein
MRCTGCSKEIKDIHVAKCPYCGLIGFWFELPTICDICRGTFNKVHIHHINGRHKDDIFNNKIKICEICHFKVHHGMTAKRPGRKNKSSGSQANYISQLLILYYRDKLLINQEKIKEDKNAKYL